MLKRIQKDKLKKYRIVALFVALYFLFTYFTLISVKPVFANVELQHHYETSGVIEDLESFFYNEENKTTTFSTDVEYDSVKLLYFLEYGYGYDELYSLYIYTYIPLNNLDINEIFINSKKNTLTFGFTESADNILKVGYEKLKITTKTVSEKLENNSWYQLNDNKSGVFVKWKVNLDDFSLMKGIKERYYCLSGIELHESGKSTATEFLIGTVFKCYKNTEKGDTVEIFKNLPSIKVDLYHTFYRTGYSSLDSSTFSGWQNQISSCYFSLPKYVGEVDASSLSSIKAEFDYYYTLPILILPNKDLYYAFERGLYKKYKDNHDPYNYNTEFPNNILYFYSLDRADGISGLCYNWSLAEYFDSNFGFYDNSFSSLKERKNTGYVFNRLSWLFYEETLSKYIKDGKITEDFYFSSSHLYNFYENALNNYFYSEENAIKGLFQEDLYVQDYDPKHYNIAQFSPYEYKNLNLIGLNRGHNELTYGIEDGDITKLTFDRLKTMENGSWLEKLGNSLSVWWSSLFNKRAYKTNEICPIEKVDYSDISALTNEELSNKYLININEVSSFRKFCNETINDNKEVWLFRYDCCEYYSNTVSCTSINNWHYEFPEKGDGYIVGDSILSDTGFVARESVYLNFDVLEFKFTQKDGNVFTVAPTHSPENVFYALTAQQDVDTPFLSDALTDLLSIILLLLFAVAFIVFVLPVLRVVFTSVKIVSKLGVDNVKNIVKNVVGFKTGSKRKRPKNDDDS